MSAANISPRDSQTTRIDPARKRLSCTSCRQRKVKCNKSDPCEPCLKTNTECVFPMRRIRTSRRQQDASDARDAMLLERIKRLEAMLMTQVETKRDGSDEDGSSGNSGSPLVTPFPKELFLGGPSIQSRMPIDDQLAAFVKQQSNSSRHLTSEFWSSLSNEFDSLRELIQGGADDEQEEEDELISQPTDETHSSPGFLFHDPDSFTGSVAKYPSEAQRNVLIRVYFANVDPVCKILHRPTTDIHFANLEQLIDPLTGRYKFRSFEAVTFAAYFAAVTSMSSQECLTHLGEQRDILIARYKHSTEVALVQADFLSTLDIITLQALTIYIMVHLSLNRARHSWTLIGLAVRIAHGMDLHRDGDGRGFSAFEAEMRRRLWWQILALDMRASGDRGSETLAETPFNTAMPTNLDDEDFGYHSQHPLQGRTGPTSITICLLGMDALWTSRKINIRFPTNEPLNLTIEERGRIVKEYVKRVESTYLANCHFSDPQTKFLYSIGQFWIYRLWLTLHYPLHNPMPPQHVKCSAKGLQSALIFLNANDIIEQHLHAAGFAWLFKTYVPWHAVAIVLAELCAQPKSILADHAWNLIETHFQDWNSRVADVKETMLWDLIKNLLKRARAARQKSQEVSEDGQALQPPNIDPDLQPTGEPGIPGLELETTLETTLDSFDLFDQTTGQPLDFLSFSPLDSMAADTELFTTPDHYDNWNDFAFDVNALGGESFLGQYGM